MADHRSRAPASPRLAEFAPAGTPSGACPGSSPGALSRPRYDIVASGLSTAAVPATTHTPAQITMRPAAKVTANMAATAANLYAAHSRLAGPWLLTVDQCDHASSASAGDLGGGWLGLRSVAGAQEQPQRGPGGRMAMSQLGSGRQARQVWASSHGHGTPSKRRAASRVGASTPHPEEDHDRSSLMSGDAATTSSRPPAPPFAAPRARQHGKALVAVQALGASGLPHG